jgi:D-alanyl-D-alanine carboxypeptidase
VPGTFQIQIGAYATEAEANRQLTSVAARARTVLNSASPVALPVKKGERQIYRARFAGFDANAAASACLELRRLAVDCFVMRAE